jgi:hypothetical protein
LERYPSKPESFDGGANEAYVPDDHDRRLIWRQVLARHALHIRSGHGAHEPGIRGEIT